MNLHKNEIDRSAETHNNRKFKFLGNRKCGKENGIFNKRVGNLENVCIKQTQKEFKEIILHKQRNVFMQCKQYWGGNAIF